MKKYVYVDLDNTLISAHDLQWQAPRNAKTLTLTSSPVPESYYAKLRPGAMDLLKRLREKYKVVMCTSAIREYAEGWNKLFELGFSEDEIIAREELSQKKLAKIPGKDDYFVLIDDLPAGSSNTVKKISKLSANITDYAIINLPEYQGRDDSVRQHITTKMVDKVIDIIEKEKTGTNIKVYDDKHGNNG